MPSTLEILANLTEVANRAAPVAMAWHAAFALAIVALWCGFRPSRRSAALLSVLPLASVAVLAWLFGNPFNGAMFSGLAVTLCALATRLPVEPVEIGRGPQRGIGALMLGFGWIYPHFLEGAAPWTYFYASPLGLIPCPTLSAVIGVTLMAGGFGSRAWSWTLAGAGALYGTFGAFGLGVWLDLGLIAGVMALSGRGGMGAACEQRPHPELR